jgi:hypothetical protein
MLVTTGALFVTGVGLFLWDFFFLAGRPVTALESERLAPVRPTA